MSAYNAEADLKKIKDALPEGKSVDFATIKQQIGEDAARPLAFVKPKSVVRRGDHYEIECAEASSVKAGDHTINMQKQVSFDLAAAGESFTATGIKGVSIALLVGSATLKELKITPSEADKSVTIDGKVTYMFISHSFSRTLTEADLPG